MPMPMPGGNSGQPGAPAAVTRNCRSYDIGASRSLTVDLAGADHQRGQRSPKTASLSWSAAGRSLGSSEAVADALTPRELKSPGRSPRRRSGWCCPAKRGLEAKRLTSGPWSSGRHKGSRSGCEGKAEALRGELEDLLAPLDEVRRQVEEIAERHQAEIEAQRRSYSEGLDRLSGEPRAVTTETSEAACTAEDKALQAKRQAEGAAARLPSELGTLRRHVETDLDAPRSCVETARRKLAEQLAGRSRAELQSAQAHLGTQTARAIGQAEVEGELAGSRADEGARLVMQLGPLRADLRRARGARQMGRLAAPPS